MGRYVKLAEQHAERIRHCHNNAGPAGYSQAEYHYQKLCGLILQASRSKNDKSDAVLIRLLIDSCGKLMDEMKEWQDTFQHTRE